eukprot:g6241.t1
MGVTLVDPFPGDILKSGANFIVHQTNCRTVGVANAKGLAKDIYEKYPYGNIYAEAWARPLPGSVVIMAPPKVEVPHDPYIVNLCGQDRPGPPSAEETAEQREAWFLHALKAFLKWIREIFLPSSKYKHDGLLRIAFPDGIGCGLAKGNPVKYAEAINAFAEQCHYYINAHVQIRVYSFKKKANPSKKEQTTKSSAQLAVEDVQWKFKKVVA